MHSIAQRGYYLQNSAHRPEVYFVENALVAGGVSRTRALSSASAAAASTPELKVAAGATLAVAVASVFFAAAAAAAAAFLRRNSSSFRRPLANCCDFFSDAIGNERICTGRDSGGNEPSSQTTGRCCGSVADSVALDVLVHMLGPFALLHSTTLPPSLPYYSASLAPCQLYRRDPCLPPVTKSRRLEQAALSACDIHTSRKFLRQYTAQNIGSLNSNDAAGQHIILHRH